MSYDYLPHLLEKADRLILDTRFYLSSVPNVDIERGSGLARQLQASRSILTDLKDYSLLTKSEIEECVRLVDLVLLPLMEYLGKPHKAHMPQCSRSATGKPGPARYNLDLHRAVQLHDMGNTWKDIAESMGVSLRTLHNHLGQAGISTAKIAYSTIDDATLDEYVSQINLHHPLSGSIVVRGHLLAGGLNIQLHRVRASLRRVDEEGVALRFRGATKRRVYRVRGSNALWHQDGNEKLKPWGFIVHGCVDGYSRMIIYLVCSNNKRSKTVGACFMTAVSQFGWPSRVRGDYGTENNEIERKMVEKWGIAHRAYLRGRSVHNVRIERLWRDVRRDTLEFFRQLFSQLEKEELLDTDCKTHLTALFLVYHPRIQKSLDETTTSWNNHSLRTERYKTPFALYELSKERAINAGYWDFDAGDNVSNVGDDYGEEGDEPGAEDSQPVPPRSDYFETLDDEIEAGIVTTDDEVLSEARDALGGMDLEKDDVKKIDVIQLDCE
ncbi:hypothetical protein D9611_012376 [Ephemerocybe angulata]|uniref:Integrase catalytic domain-containing protein n=1 Tax=Ephemerocybe angulata TaxID=980116 RepID=A0A8H5CEG6_9AGAR|nr:hypothetical protein D9611_012376 [Tulosesus angulatus]